MTTSGDFTSSSSKTLLPAKQPDINPWLQRLSLKHPIISKNKATTTTTTADAAAAEGAPISKNTTTIDSSSSATAPTTISAVGANDKKSQLATENSIANLKDSADTELNFTTTKVKPTGKEKWVPLDATITVDTTTDAPKKKKLGNKKKKNNKKKQDGHNKDVVADQNNINSSENINTTGGVSKNHNGNKRKGDRKSKQELKKVEIKKDNNNNDDVDEIASKIASKVTAVDLNKKTDDDDGIPEDNNDDQVLNSNTKEELKKEEPILNFTNVEKEANLDIEKDVEATTTTEIVPPPSQSESPPLTEDHGRRRSSSRSGRSHHNGTPKYRRSSSQIPTIPIQQFPTLHPYLQQMYGGFYTQPPVYPMNQFHHPGRHGRYSQANSSSSSIDDITTSPSPSSNGYGGYNKNSEPFFPQQQQFIPFYQFQQPLQHQQVYPMMPPPPISPPHHMPPPYIPEGSPIYNNINSNKREQFSRSNSVIQDREYDVAMQLDYYFSKENLIKDTYLRSNMKDGYINLKIIMKFLRFKSLTGGDINLAINSLSRCANIDYKIIDGDYFLKSKFEYFFKK